MSFRFDLEGLIFITTCLDAEDLRLYQLEGADRIITIEEMVDASKFIAVHYAL